MKDVNGDGKEDWKDHILMQEMLDSQKKEEEKKPHYDDGEYWKIWTIIAICGLLLFKLVSCFVS